MSLDKQLIFALLMGAIGMAVIQMALDDWKTEADAREEAACKDKSPEFRAVMARLPGEAHSAESCLQAIRFGSKEFVPEFGLPLPPDKVKLGRDDGHATR